MGYEHSMSVEVAFKKGVTIEQIASAFKPILEYLEIDPLKGKMHGDNEFTFDPATGGFYLFTGGGVSCGFADMVEEVINDLGPLCSEAGELTLKDFDTADLKNAITTFVFGPSDDAIAQYRFDCELQNMQGLIPLIGEDGYIAMMELAKAQFAQHKQTAPAASPAP